MFSPQSGPLTDTYFKEIAIERNVMFECGYKNVMSRVDTAFDISHSFLTKSCVF